MRGKLRDKRPETKRDNFKRASLERRHTNKRDSRSLAVQLHQQYEQEDDYNLDDEEILVESAQK
jgi:hypothetical protein